MTSFSNTNLFLARHRVQNRHKGAASYHTNLSHYVSLKHLSLAHKNFIVSLNPTIIPNTVSEALTIREWKDAMSSVFKDINEARLEGEAAKKRPKAFQKMRTAWKAYAFYTKAFQRCRGVSLLRIEQRCIRLTRWLLGA